MYFALPNLETWLRACVQPVARGSHAAQSKVCAAQFRFSL